MADVPPELSAEIRTLEQKHSENPAGRFFVPLANAYRKAGELGQAEQLLREGLRRHPDYLSAHIVLGRCFADRGATRPAVAEFRHVLGIDPQNLIALRTLGELAAVEGEQAQAEYWFRELLAVDPLNEEARQMLDALRPAPPPPPDDLPEFGAPAGHADQITDPGPDDDQGWEEDKAWWELQPEEAPVADAEPVPGATPPPAPPPIGENDPAGHAPDGPDDGWPMAEDEAPEPEHSGPAGEISLQGAEAPAPAGDALGVSPPREAGRVAEQATAAGDEPAAAAATGSPRAAPHDDSAPDATAGDDLWIDADDVADDLLPGFGDAAVVTETIAELYARQGFYDRAADVYRKLLAGRGDDERLRKRLAEVVAQEDAARAGEGTAAAAPAGAGGAPLPQAEEDRHAEGASPAEGAELDVDAELFITSLSGMFDGERVWELQAAAPADEEPGGVAASMGVPARDGAGTVAPPTSVSEYLAGLLAWRPGAAPAAAPRPDNEAEEDLESFQAWLRSLKR